MIIDFHNHYYPPEYLDAVKAGRSAIKLDYDAEGNPRLHYPGDYNILVPGHRDLDYRAQVLADHGVDMQVPPSRRRAHTSRRRAGHRWRARERRVCPEAKARAQFTAWPRCR
jgi:hypothetical protein